MVPCSLRSLEPVIWGENATWDHDERPLCGCGSRPRGPSWAVQPAAAGNEECRIQSRGRGVPSILGVWGGDGRQIWHRWRQASTCGGQTCSPRNLSGLPRDPVPGQLRAPELAPAPLKAHVAEVPATQLSPGGQQGPSHTGEGPALGWVSAVFRDGASCLLTE